jgi:hypothetical protein
MYERPLLEPHDVDDGSGSGQYAVTTTSSSSSGAGSAQQAGETPPNPIDALFAGTRWKREDLMFVYAALTLLLLLLQVWTILKVRK